MQDVSSVVGDWDCSVLASREECREAAFSPSCHQHRILQSPWLTSHRPQSQYIPNCGSAAEKACMRQGSKNSTEVLAPTTNHVCALFDRPRSQVDDPVICFLLTHLIEAHPKLTIYVLPSSTQLFHLYRFPRRSDSSKRHKAKHPRPYARHTPYPCFGMVRGAGRPEAKMAEFQHITGAQQVHAVYCQFTAVQCLRILSPRWQLRPLTLASHSPRPHFHLPPQRLAS